MRLQNKVALVTGAARGLGASIARAFHREGARVMLADLRDEEGEALAKSLGERADYLHLDVASEPQWQAVLEVTEARFGRLTTLVNNAGIYRLKPFTEITLAEYMQVVGINQVGCFLGMRTCVPAILHGGGGSVINIASTAGLEGIAGALPYTASKHAVVGMTRAAALELATRGVRVNVVCPGGMATPLVAESFNMSLESLRSVPADWSPMRRMGDPDEVAGTVVFLASDDSSFTTGSVLVADGGLMAGVPGGPQ